MINTTHPHVIIHNYYLQKVLHDRDTIRALAVQLVGAQVEAHLDMISDAGTIEYGTFKEVAGCIQGAKESVKDYIADLLADFTTTLYEEVAKVKVETKAFIQKPTADGRIDIDAEVDVTID
jgi:hypothetical protein